MELLCAACPESLPWVVGVPDVQVALIRGELFMLASVLIPFLPSLLCSLLFPGRPAPALDQMREGMNVQSP